MASRSLLYGDRAKVDEAFELVITCACCSLPQPRYRTWTCREDISSILRQQALYVFRRWLIRVDRHAATNPARDDLDFTGCRKTSSALTAIRCFEEGNTQIRRAS